MKKRMGICSLAALVSLIAWSGPAAARPVPFRNYDALTKEADLVVIAAPISTYDTRERSQLTDIAPPIPVIGVETVFEVSAVLKGNVPERAANEKRRFVLHHYRQQNETAVPNGPGLVRFQPSSRKQYLLFLKKDSDGRFQASSGQTDPDLSIEPLRWER